MNNVHMIGRLTKDVELRYTQSGVAVGSVSIAVDRRFKNQNGERETDFFNCVIWRKAAENFANFTGKGARVAISGTLQTRNYENNQGQKVYVTEVLIENFDLLESKAEADNRRANNGQQSNSYQQQNNQQQSGARQQNNQFNDVDPFATPAQNGGMQFNDDDLPF